MELHGRKVEFEIDGIDIGDYPKFCDAYISKAWFTDTGVELSDTEMEHLAECYADEMCELAHQELINQASMLDRDWA